MEIIIKSYLKTHKKCKEISPKKKKLGRKTKRSADSTNGDGNATNSNKKEKIYDRFSDDNMRKSKKTLF